MCLSLYVPTMSWQSTANCSVNDPHCSFVAHILFNSQQLYRKIIIIKKENSKTHSLLQQLHKHCRMCALNSKQYETDLRTHLQPILSTITKMSYCWVYGICIKRRRAFEKLLIFRRLLNGVMPTLKKRSKVKIACRWRLNNICASFARIAYNYH